MDGFADTTVTEATSAVRGTLGCEQAGGRTVWPPTSVTVPTFVGQNPPRRRIGRKTQGRGHFGRWFPCCPATGQRELSLMPVELRAPRTIDELGIPESLVH